MPKINRLTVKQEKFVNEVIKGQSYRQAALNAGYSPQTANNATSDILTNPIVEKELTTRLGQEGIDADYVLKNLKKDIDFCEEPNPVRTKSLELVGKHLGLFDRNGDGEEGFKGAQGMPPERREAVFSDILELVDRGAKKDDWIRNLREWLQKVPPELRSEAEEIFQGDVFTEIMFAEIDLLTRLHFLGEEYRRRVPCEHCGKVTIKGAHN